MTVPAIKFEFFRVAPVLMFFVSAALAIALKSYAWTFMFVGLVINGAIWGIINPIMKQKYPALSQRPKKTQCYYFHQKTLTNAGGFPSGHSQSTAFFSTWLVLMALHNHVPIPVLIITIAIALWLTLGMMISRVHDYQCHTTLQASTGSIIGIVTALALWPIFLLL